MRFSFFLLFLIPFHMGFCSIDEQQFHKAEGREYKGLTYEEEGRWNEPFFFIQMADCQLGMFDHDLCWDKEILLLEQAVDHINRLRPKFVIVCGDLTNAKPFKKAYDEQVYDYKRIMSRVSHDIPLVCVCGNHDVGNKPSAKKIKAYEDNFGSHYFSFWVGGVQCFTLNSSLFFNPSKAEEMFREQREWIETELVKTLSLNPKHRLVFTHHPWFIRDPEKLSLPIFEIPLERRMDIMNLLVDQNVTACFAGHYHRNAYGVYKGMEVVTTSALGKPIGKDPSGFRIVKVFEDRVEHEYFGIDEVPESVSLQSE
ncbi:MAG: 3',5'-cyclic adenosine monophosphate phosphodiesterase CpdA [Chlamydiae bacterium]|nr:3',5'-cyclic adenosine monophosphate phosphodiesterase CpdA [Chlamydiota bacterium]